MDVSEEERKQTLWEYLIARTRNNPNRMRPLMIMLLALGVGLVFIGVVLTIVGNLPGYSGGSVLKIVGPLVLGVGALILIGVIIDGCVRSEQASKARELEKTFSDLTSSRSTVTDAPGVVSQNPNGWKQSGDTDVKVPIATAHPPGSNGQNKTQNQRNGVPLPAAPYDAASHRQPVHQQPVHPGGHQDHMRGPGQVPQGQNSHFQMHPQAQHPNGRQPQGQQPHGQHMPGGDSGRSGHAAQSDRGRSLSKSVDDEGYLQPKDIPPESRLLYHPSNKTWPSQQSQGQGQVQKPGPSGSNTRSGPPGTGKYQPKSEKSVESKQQLSDPKSGAPVLQLPKMRWGKKKHPHDKEDKRKSGDAGPHSRDHSPEHKGKNKKHHNESGQGFSWGRSKGRSNEAFDGPKESTPKDPEERTDNKGASNKAFEGETPKLKHAREKGRAEREREHEKDKLNRGDRNRPPHDSSLESQASRSRPSDPSRARESGRHRDSRRGRSSSRHKSDKDTSKGSRESSVGRNKSRDSSLGRNKSVDDFNTINYLTGAPIDKNSRRKHRDGTSSDDDSGRRRAKHGHSSSRQYDDHDRNKDTRLQSKSREARLPHHLDSFDKDDKHDRRHRHADLNSSSTSGDYRKYHDRDGDRLRKHRGFDNDTFRRDSPEDDNLEERDRHRHHPTRQKPRTMERAESTDTTLMPYKPQNHQVSNQSLNVVSPNFTININAQAGSHVQIAMGGDKALGPPKVQPIKEASPEPDSIV